MNREQFIAQLARLLHDLPPAERQEAHSLLSGIF